MDPLKFRLTKYNQTSGQPGNHPGSVLRFPEAFAPEAPKEAIHRRGAEEAVLNARKIQDGSVRRSVDRRML